MPSFCQLSWVVVDVGGRISDSGGVGDGGVGNGGVGNGGVAGGDDDVQLAVEPCNANSI